MNNLLSLEWLGEYVALTCPPAELARRLSLVGAGVEHVTAQGADLEKIVVGKIMSLEAHPNADTLTVCRVQTGRDIRTIVCGGTNLRRDMLVAVALPGARVRWHGAGEPVAITETVLRGVKSAGMICAASEIGLSDAFPAAAEREILDLDFLKLDSSHGRDAAPRAGMPLADALHLNDTIFEIEATTNRPDLMSVVGIARETVAARAAKFKKSFAHITEGKKIKSRVPLVVAEKKLCPRYSAARVSGVRVAESPWWLKRRLLAAGVRPINNIVDITNYVRVELGQPMHAFDAAAVDKKIIVRRAHDGEKFLALDDSAHTLTRDALVIADEKKVLCIAGIMGGRESGVTAATTDIIFEAAAFDAVSVRRTARALGLYSDSQLLFEKGLSVCAPEFAMARALELCVTIAGGAVVALTDFSAAPYRAPHFAFDFRETEKFIGTQISVSEQKRILTSLGFGIAGKKITVPWWRDHDIESGRDFMEEIARVFGYHNVPAAALTGAIPDRAPAALLVAEKNLREFFVGAGFNEIYTNSFLRADEITRAAHNVEHFLALANPLSSELTHLRPSMLPSILKVVAENESHAPTGRIFEVSNVYLPRAGETPQEELQLAVCVWGSAYESAEKNSAGQEFFAAKGAAEELFHAWGISADAFEVAAQGNASQEKIFGASWHQGRTLLVKNPRAEENFPRGVIAEVHPAVTRAFGISARVAVFMISVESLLEMRAHGKKYAPPPMFPPAKRDIAFVVPERTTYAALKNFFDTVDAHLAAAELFDTFRGAGVGAQKKSLAFHLTYSAPDHTLTNEEVEKIHQGIIKKITTEFSAEVRE